MLYFWKAECSRMSNMTFPCVNAIQLGPSLFKSFPQCKKSSLRYHFSPNSGKLGSQKLLHQGHFRWRSKFFSFTLPSGPWGMFEPNSATSNTHKHPKTPTNTHKTPTNTHKEWCYHTFVKEWMKAPDKTRILAPSDYFYHFSFPSYGRLKSKTIFPMYFWGPVH